MDWFERLTGFREESYEATRAKLGVEGDRLQSLVNGKSWYRRIRTGIASDSARTRGFRNGDAKAAHSGGAICCAPAILAPGDRPHYKFDLGQWGELFCNVGEPHGVDMHQDHRFMIPRHTPRDGPAKSPRAAPVIKARIVPPCGKLASRATQTPLTAFEASPGRA